MCHPRYLIERDELSRRIYGPETLNVQSVADILSSGSGAKLTLPQVKARLLAADFDCAVCPPVTSAFTRLCEGQVAGHKRVEQTLTFEPVCTIQDYIEIGQIRVNSQTRSRSRDMYMAEVLYVWFCGFVQARCRTWLVTTPS